LPPADRPRAQQSLRFPPGQADVQDLAGSKLIVPVAAARVQLIEGLACRALTATAAQCAVALFEPDFQAGA
jgi:hypothetical protein